MGFKKLNDESFSICLSKTKSETLMC